MWQAHLPRMAKGSNSTLIFLGCRTVPVVLLVRLPACVKCMGRAMLTRPTEYHVHDQPVPADGNCTGTKAHLDPYLRGQLIPCDKSDPASCQVGDLSGKHGNITRSPFQVTYVSHLARKRSLFRIDCTSLDIIGETLISFCVATLIFTSQPRKGLRPFLAIAPSLYIPIT